MGKIKLYGHIFVGVINGKMPWDLQVLINMPILRQKNVTVELEFVPCILPKKVLQILLEVEFIAMQFPFRCYQLIRLGKVNLKYIFFTFSLLIYCLAKILCATNFMKYLHTYLKLVGDDHGTFETPNKDTHDACVQTDYVEFKDDKQGFYKSKPK